jgi:hypothetical protein
VCPCVCVCVCVIKKPRKGRPKVRPGLQAPVNELMNPLFLTFCLWEAVGFTQFGITLLSEEASEYKSGCTD